MRFGYNYLAVPSKTDELRHAKAAQLGGGLFFQPNIDFAREFKAALPNANVVIRNWPDRAVPQSVDDWLFHNRSYGEGGLIVQTCNEVGFGQANIDFHVALLERIKRDNIDMRVGILGLSVGTPDPDNDWPRAERLLRLAADMRDKVHLILHEYYGAVITSGFIGGNPTMIQPDTWPQNTSGLTMWHVGRYRFLKRFCESKGIPLPRIIIGEFGADFTADIETWLKTLQSTRGAHDVVDGWRDLFDQWRIWWPQWDAATAYMKQAEYADKHIYTDPEVETILFYCRWNDGSWGTYQTNPELDAQVEAYGQSAPTVPPVETPPPAPAPDPAIPVDIGDPTPLTVEGEWVLRAEPSINSPRVGILQTGEMVNAYRLTATPNGGHNWHVVKRLEQPAGEAAQGWSALPLPPVVQPPAPPEPVPVIDLRREYYNLLKQLAAVALAQHSLFSGMADKIMQQIEAENALKPAAQCDSM